MENFAARPSDGFPLEFDVSVHSAGADEATHVLCLYITIDALSGKAQVLGQPHREVDFGSAAVGIVGVPAFSRLARTRPAEKPARIDRTDGDTVGMGNNLDFHFVGVRPNLLSRDLHLVATRHLRINRAI